MPKLSILMPFMNMEKFLSSSIEAVQRQTFKDWELILVDDGSTDQSQTIAKRYAEQDSRIRLLIQPHNKGIAHSCNLAFAESKGEWVARCDSDDIALPYRFERQFAYAANKPEIDVWGALIFEKGQESKRFFIRETDPDMVGIAALFHIPIINQTFLCKRNVIESLGSFYDPQAKFEDYAFLVECLGQFTLSNMPQPVMMVRKHGTSFTAHLTPADNVHYNLIYQKRLLQRLGVLATPEELELHRQIVVYYHRARRERDFGDLPTLPLRTEVQGWFKKICQANKTTRLFEPTKLFQRLNEVSFWFPEENFLLDDYVKF